jgi:hypothetical protein
VMWGGRWIDIARSFFGKRLVWTEFERWSVGVLRLQRNFAVDAIWCNVGSHHYIIVVTFLFLCCLNLRMKKLWKNTVRVEANVCISLFISYHLNTVRHSPQGLAQEPVDYQRVIRGL